MKILFSLLAFCLFASCVHSQEAVDTVSVRVQYRALYKHTQEQKEAYDDINLLDIGRHSSRFYSQRFEQFLHQRDSVKSMNTDPISYLQFLANTFGSRGQGTGHCPCATRCTSIYKGLATFYIRCSGGGIMKKNKTC